MKANAIVRLVRFVMMAIMAITFTFGASASINAQSFDDIIPDIIKEKGAEWSAEKAEEKANKESGGVYASLKVVANFIVSGKILNPFKYSGESQRFIAWLALLIFLAFYLGKNEEKDNNGENRKEREEKRSEKEETKKGMIRILIFLALLFLLLVTPPLFELLKFFPQIRGVRRAFEYLMPVACLVALVFRKKTLHSGWIALSYFRGSGLIYFLRYFTHPHFNEAVTAQGVTVRTALDSVSTVPKPTATHTDTQPTSLAPPIAIPVVINPPAPVVIPSPNCTSCKNKLGEPGKFCDSCGAPDPRSDICTSCGNEMGEPGKFCDSCGAPDHRSPS